MLCPFVLCLVYDSVFQKDYLCNHILPLQKWMQMIKWEVWHNPKNMNFCSLSFVKPVRFEAPVLLTNNETKLKNPTKATLDETSPHPHTPASGGAVLHQTEEWHNDQWYRTKLTPTARWKTLHAGWDFACFLNHRENLRQVYKTDYHHSVGSFRNIRVLLYGCVILFLKKKIAMHWTNYLLLCFFFICL